MSLEAGMVALLKADAAVAALIGDRVYPAPAQQGGASPFVTYQMIGIDRVGRSFNGTYVFDDEVFQIDCWSESESGGYAETIAVADAVIAALDNQVTAFGDPLVADIQMTDQRDLPEVDGDRVTRRRQLDFAFRQRDC